MAKYQTLWWSEIPVGVKATDDAGTVRRQLNDRYQNAVDAVATATGRIETTKYLEQWNWSDKSERAGPASEVAEAVVAELEAAYPGDRLGQIQAHLVESFGRVPKNRRERDPSPTETATN
jgi:hypothetical protein